MKDIFKNPFFIIILVIAVIITAFSVICSVTGNIAILDNAIGTVLSPFQKAGTAIGNFFSGIADYFTAFDELKAENEDLKNQVREMKELASEAEKLKKENDWLYGYLEIKRSNTSFVLQNATVISRNHVGYLSTFMIDKGSMHGLESGMTVITANGLIGCVKTVGLNYANCISILHPDFSAAVYAESRVSQGAVKGDFELAGDGIIKMAYLPESTDIVTGDIIKTSGIGGIFPRGLYVGEVTEILPDSFSKTLYAKVKIAENIDKVENVMIIKSFTEIIG